MEGWVVAIAMFGLLVFMKRSIGKYRENIERRFETYEQNGRPAQAQYAFYCEALRHLHEAIWFLCVIGVLLLLIFLQNL